MKTFFTYGSLTAMLFFVGMHAAQAHVVVSPSSAGIGKYQTFTVSVPSEKDIPTVALRLILPEGIQHVTPTVKNGWSITTENAPDPANASSTQIVWRGSLIPAGERDEFSFSAQVPAASTTLIWKAYQTYADGSVVSWDADPASIGEEDDDDSNQGPYSRTAIIDDLTPKQEHDSHATAALAISIVALAISLYRITQDRLEKRNS